MRETHGFASQPRGRFAFIGAIFPMLKRPAAPGNGPTKVNDIVFCLSRINFGTDISVRSGLFSLVNRVRAVLKNPDVVLLKKPHKVPIKLWITTLACADRALEFRVDDDVIELSASSVAQQRIMNNVRWIA